MSYEYVTIGELEPELCVRLLLGMISSLTFSRVNVFSSVYIFCQCIFKYCIYGVFQGVERQHEFLSDASLDGIFR